MVGALPLKVFKPLPGLVEGLSFLLGEGCNLYPQLCSFSWWEVFAEEGLGENLPGGERVGLLVLQLVTSSVPQ